MLTFFRRIRKGLLEGGATQKYLIYVIGEILLVMIGILLALQVNNWNEWRKERKEENSYLLRLSTDLLADLTYIVHRLNKSKDEMNELNKVLHEAYKEQNDLQEVKDLISRVMFTNEHMTIQDITYTEMISSGKLDILSNDSLKVAIGELYRQYESSAKHIQEFSEYAASLRVEQIMTTTGNKYHEFFSAIIDEPIMFQNEDWQWLNNPQSFKFKIFEETVLTYWAKHHISIKYFEQLSVEVDQLLVMIKKELDQAE